MPALVAFGRKWRIGSDDFVFPALTEAFVRFSWAALGLLVIILNYPLNCKNGTDEKELTIYLTVLLGVNFITTVLCLVMAKISARGAIMDPRPRHNLPKVPYFFNPTFINTHLYPLWWPTILVEVLYIRCPLFLLEIAWTLIATIEVFCQLKN